MSSDSKKDLVTKTADKDVGLARTPSVEERDEIFRSDEDEDEDEESETSEADDDQDENKETGVL
jgi:hypothetical protein